MPDSSPSAPPPQGSLQRKIIHVDMDAFFASVEQRDNPDLRGKPVAVGGIERGVVAAASYEARPYGVRSAMPSKTALRLCPGLIFVRPRFEVYKEVSAQIREIFALHTPIIEPLSLDEAYLDVTENLTGMATATAVAEDIRARIKAVTGLTASAGVSYNKFLAKIASDQNKPDGLCIITPRQGEGFVETLPVRKFHGVGPATTERMKKLGIETGADLKRQSLEFLTKHFGVSGAYYYGISRGVDTRPVRPDRVRKSAGAENTFLVDVADYARAEEKLLPIIDKVWRYIDTKALKGRTVTLKVKFSDFRQITRSTSVRLPVGDRDTLIRLSLGLLADVFPVTKPIRLLGVTLSSFDDEVDEDTPAQLALGL